VTCSSATIDTTRQSGGSVFVQVQAPPVPALGSWTAFQVAPGTSTVSVASRFLLPTKWADKIGQLQGSNRV
jgi:hypothetical protein